MTVGVTRLLLPIHAVMAAHHACRHKLGLHMAMSKQQQFACDKMHALQLQHHIICSSCKQNCLHLAIICVRAHDCKELAGWVQQFLPLQMAHIAMYAGRETISKTAVALQAAML
jgi:hypothetical protein